jgi:hypothetical protein
MCNNSIVYYRRLNTNFDYIPSYVSSFILSFNRIATCRGVCMVLGRMIGFIGAALQLHFVNNQYSTIAGLHTFQFTATHALGFSVSSSRCLVADLNTGTSTSNHYKSSCQFFFSHLGMATQLSNSVSPVSMVLDSVLHGTNLCSTYLSLFPLFSTIRFLATDL